MTAIEFEKHAPITHFDVQDDCLTLAGRKLTDIVADAGYTPLYIYDRSVIAARVAGLRAAFQDTVDLHYAMKANPMPELVHYAATLVDGLDVASGLELDVALASGCPASEISFAGPGKQPEELEQAIAAGITLNVESETELVRIGDIATRTRRTANVSLRVNPDFQLKTSGMKMGGGAQQFGLDAEMIPGVFAAWRNGTHPADTSNISFAGFHIYSGSQNLSVAALIETQIKTVDLAAKLAANAPGPVRLLNIGGGFGIPYFPGEQPLDVSLFSDHAHALHARTQRCLPHARLTIELGRYLVGECGVYVCRITDKKVSRGKTFLIANGGLHHHLAASGNFGQILRKNYPVIIGNRVAAGQPARASLVGPLCTPLDLLADQMLMADADIGDLAVVFQSGAYGFSASPQAFLSHPPPREILL